MPYLNIKVTQDSGPNGTGPGDSKNRPDFGMSKRLSVGLRKDPAAIF